MTLLAVRKSSTSPRCVRPGAASRAARRMLMAALALALALASLGAAAWGVVPPELVAQGARDGATPAWMVSAPTPVGWTGDCCTYAKAIGVTAVAYRGTWTGKPQQVMVLNVWPRKLPTLAAEVAADRAHYLRLDPAGKATQFAVRHHTMTCTAAVYQGSDRIDDVLVFCDPGVASGIRLSWSMTLDANDRQMRALLGDFMRVVVATRYHAER